MIKRRSGFGASLPFSFIMDNCLPETLRRGGSHAAEYPREVALIGESAFGRNVGEGPLRIP